MVAYSPPSATISTKANVPSPKPSISQTHVPPLISLPTVRLTTVLKTHLRCERQTLHRLPGSEAIVFSFKTYLYPLSEIKNEGLGEELAQAVDGLKGGSVPGMHFYKRAVVWGEVVKAYLRS